MSETNTDFTALQEGQKKRYIRFDPTVSSGTILQLVSMLLIFAGAYGTYQSDKTTTKLELDQVKAAVASEKSATKESLSEIKLDVKEVQKTLNQISQSIAVMEVKQKDK